MLLASRTLLTLFCVAGSISPLLYLWKCWTFVKAQFKKVNLLPSQARCDLYSLWRLLALVCPFVPLSTTYSAYSTLCQIASSTVQGLTLLFSLLCIQHSASQKEDLVNKYLNNRRVVFSKHGWVESWLFKKYIWLWLRPHEIVWDLRVLVRELPTMYL